MSQTRPLMTVAEIAAHLRVSKMTVYRMLEDGEMEYVKFSRTFRVPVDAFEKWLADHEVKPS